MDVDSQRSSLHVYALLATFATKPRGPAITVRSIARIEDDSKSKVEEGKERIRGKAPSHKVHTIVTGTIASVPEAI